MNEWVAARINNMTRLMVVIVISGGLAHGIKSFNDASVIPAHLRASKSIFENLSVQDAYDFLNPLLISRNVERAAFLVARFDRSIYNELLEKILSSANTNISAREKLEFLGYLLATCDEQKEFYELFELLLVHKDQLAIEYFLHFIADPLYDKVLRMFVGWYDSRNEQEQKNIFDTIVTNGIKNVIDNNEVKRLEWLLANSSFVAVQGATILLSYVVENKKDPGFVLPLVKQAKADVDHQDANKKTLLLRAVELDNLEMVRALLEQGADVAIISSPEIGSALQNAIIYGHVPVELLLRSFGAR